MDFISTSTVVLCGASIMCFSFRTNHKFGQSLVATPDSVKPLTINSGTICAVIVHGYGGKGTDSMSLVLRDGIYTLYIYIRYLHIQSARLNL